MTTTLAELEQAARDGQPVSAAKMAQAVAAAEAADRIAALAAQGEQERVDRAAEVERQRRQAEAKAAALEEVPALRAECDRRRQAALDALVALGDACDQYGAAVARHAEVYRLAGIPCANWATSMDPRTDQPAVDGLDPANYAWFSEGMVVRQLEVAGVTHAPTMYPADVHMENVAGEARTVRERNRATRQ